MSVPISDETMASDPRHPVRRRTIADENRYRSHDTRMQMSIVITVYRSGNSVEIKRLAAYSGIRVERKLDDSD